MDFNSFNLEDNGDLFKHNYQVENNTGNDASTDFFNFMDENTNAFENNGHNPDFKMSPLQIASQTVNPIIQTYHTPLQHPIQQNSHLEEFGDDEEFFTPLVSPAMPPTYDNNYLVGMNNNNQIFSPLSSPALNPSSSTSSSTGDQATLQQKLAFIERQQQQLRNMHNKLRPSSSPILNSFNTQETKKALKQKILQSSPRPFAIPKSKCESPLALKPMTPHTSFVNRSPNKVNPFISPATPSLLMKLGGGNTLSSSSSNLSTSSLVDNMPVLPDAMLQPEDSYETIKRRRISQSSPPHDILASPAGLRPQQSPRALKPLISPSLKPNGKRLSSLEEETARALLTSKSNYENLKEGKAKSLGIDFSTTIQSGIENRRSAHKAAEQKRRDTLKQSFDSLRTEIIDAMMEEEENQDRIAKEKDVKQMSKVVLLQHSYEYILRLKNDNKRKDEKQSIMRQELYKLRKQLGLPEITPEEKQAEIREKIEEEERKKARLKRLQNAAAGEEEL